MCRSVLDSQPLLDRGTAVSLIVYLIEQPKASFVEAFRGTELFDRADFHILFSSSIFGTSWDEVATHTITKAEKLGAELVIDTLPQFAGLKGGCKGTSAGT